MSEGTRYVPRILRDDGMIAFAEVAHYTHLNLVQYVTVADHDAALRRAKAEGAREMIKIVNDNKADQRVADNLDNTLSFDSFNEVLDVITCEIDARAAQIEEGE